MSSLILFISLIFTKEQVKTQKQDYKTVNNAANRPKNKHVYFDISYTTSDKPVLGRLVMELFSEVTPRTAENFYQLCKGFRAQDNKKYSYKKSIFHRVIKNFMIQGGDITRRNGTGGLSIFGQRFEDENFDVLHEKPGLLSMANSGSNTNGSQFFITTNKTSWLDGKHVVFGQVIKGFEHVKAISELKTIANDVPQKDVIIVNCGDYIVASEEEPQLDNKYTHERIKSDL